MYSYMSIKPFSTLDPRRQQEPSSGYKCFWNTGVWPPACDMDMLLGAERDETGSSEILLMI